MDINLSLTLDEVKFVLGVIGELPTKTGAWPLVEKISAQTQPQIPAPEQTGE